MAKSVLSLIICNATLQSNRTDPGSFMSVISGELLFYREENPKTFHVIMLVNSEMEFPCDKWTSISPKCWPVIFPLANIPTRNITPVIQGINCWTRNGHAHVITWNVPDCWEKITVMKKEIMSASKDLINYSLSAIPNSAAD